MAALFDTTSYTENYLRLHLLEVKGGTPVLRELFLKIVNNSSAKGDVDVYLNYFKDDLKQVKSSTSAEYQMLFPSHGKTDINKWDISLLAYILIHCCTVEGQLSLKGKLNPKEILKQEVKTTGGLDSFLSINKSNIVQMEFTDEQNKILYPPNGQPSDIKSWDIEVLLRILFWLCGRDNLQKICTVCKYIVTRQVALCDTGIRLAKFLSKTKHTFQKLRKDAKLSDSQYKQLYPRVFTSDIGNWDNDVLLIVVLNACQSFSQTTYDDVKTVRNMRKELGAHAERTEITDNEFREKWQYLSGAITGILCSELPNIKKGIEDAIYNFLRGPLDIMSSIAVLTECYRNYDTKYNNILKTLSVIKSNTESIAQTMQVGFATTSRNIHQSERNIILKMDSGHQLILDLTQQFEAFRTEEPAYSETREIKCFDVIFVVRGSSKETLDKVEFLIIKAFDGIQDHETEKIKEVTDIIMELLSKDKTAIVETRRGSVILVVKCVSVQGLHMLFNTLDSNEFKGRLNDQATVLTELTGCQIGVTAYIPAPSLQIILDEIKQVESRIGMSQTGHKEYTGSVKVRLKATSVKGLAHIWQTVQDDSFTKKNQILSEMLSNQFNEKIEVSVLLQPEVIQAALQLADFPAKKPTSTRRDQLPKRKPSHLVSGKSSIHDSGLDLAGNFLAEKPTATRRELLKRKPSRYVSKKGSIHDSGIDLAGNYLEMEL